VTGVPVGTAASGWWLAHVAASAGQRGRVFIVQSAVHPDGTSLEVTPEQHAAGLTQGWVAVATCRTDGSVTSLVLADRVAPQAPPLWFVEVRESAADTPAVNLLAFSAHGQAAGTLMDRADLSNVAVRRADQLGAIRWWPAAGEVDQIYVNPAWRRRGIGTSVVHAAAVLTAARGWSRLWSDGQRTVLGEQFRGASFWRHRTAELTHVAPPMTPGDAGSGDDRQRRSMRAIDGAVSEPIQTTPSTSRTPVAM
jgi:GNAT superfamily N-acetyltransferase